MGPVLPHLFSLGMFCASLRPCLSWSTLIHPLGCGVGNSLGNSRQKWVEVQEAFQDHFGLYCLLLHYHRPENAPRERKSGSPFIFK